MKIIAVDDDDVSLDLLKFCLAGGGYEDLTLMSSPLKALEAIKDAKIGFDCILLDVEMPDKDGIQLCADIRKIARYRNTPILMITKHKKHAEVEKAFANGATDYITKPFEFFEVLTRIRVAERLVQERQAAIDSYIAVQNLENRQNEKVGAKAAARKPELAMPAEQFQVTGDDLLAFSVFQNYLERVTRNDECQINLVVMKIANVDQIFAQTDAVEFVEFLKSAAGAMHHEAKPEKAFMTHAGNGVFLIATRGFENFDAEATEAGILSTLENGELPKVCRSTARPVIIVGSPLHLSTMAKLNFKRAVKAAMARMEQRETILNRSGLSLLAG